MICRGTAVGGVAGTLRNRWACPVGHGPPRSPSTLKRPGSLSHSRTGAILRTVPLPIPVSIAPTGVSDVGRVRCRRRARGR